MEKVFVTGATGFIGTRLVQALVDRGRRVRALSRRGKAEPPPGHAPGQPAPLDHEHVEIVAGDITDRDSLVRGMAGCQRVFHLAAYAKNWAADPRTFHRLNVEGMRNVFDAARHQGVERVVWTSSIVTFGPTPPGVVGDEAMPRTAEDFYTDYEATKTIAEREALQLAADGFPVVIVNPTRVYGPGHLTEGNALSQVIDLYDRGRFPCLMNRGINVGNYVLVDDVVQGHLLAMEKGRIGERYILGGENATFRDFLRHVDRVSGKRHVQIPLRTLGPLFFAYLQKKRAEWFGVHPAITPGWVRTFAVDWAYRCDKAQRELGYQPTPLAEGMRITYEWLQARSEESGVTLIHQPIRDAFCGSQRKPTVILLVSGPLLLAWRYCCAPAALARGLAAMGCTAPGCDAIGHFVSGFVLLGVLPALIVKFVFRERLRDYGVGLGLPGRTLRATLRLVPVFVLAGYLASRDPEIAARFPINAQARASVAAFVLHAATYLLYYIGWEFFFRGFMLHGLRGTLGDANAVLIQTLASALLHIGGPVSETFGAIPGGLLWGVLALHTRSMGAGLAQHFALGIALDAFLCLESAAQPP